MFAEPIRCWILYLTYLDLDMPRPTGRGHYKRCHLSVSLSVAYIMLMLFAILRHRKFCCQMQGECQKYPIEKMSKIFKLSRVAQYTVLPKNRLGPKQAGQQCLKRCAARRGKPCHNDLTVCLKHGPALHVEYSVGRGRNIQ